MKKHNYTKLIIAGIISFCAVPVLAAPQNLKELINGFLINGLLKPIVPVIVSLAVVAFLYGVFKYIFASGGEEKEKGRDFMIWGIVGLFVMVSIWGFVSILSDTLNLDNTPRTIQIVPPRIN